MEDEEGAGGPSGAGPAPGKRKRTEAPKSPAADRKGKKYGNSRACSQSVIRFLMRIVCFLAGTSELRKRLKSKTMVPAPMPSRAVRTLPSFNNFYKSGVSSCVPLHPRFLASTIVNSNQSRCGG